MVYKTPGKEDDVLVMDGIPVKSPSPGSDSCSGKSDDPAGSGRFVRPLRQSGYSSESEPFNRSGRFARPQLLSGYSSESEPGNRSGRFVRPPLQSGYSSGSEPGYRSGSFVRPPLQSGYSSKSEPVNISGRFVRPLLQSGYSSESKPGNGSGKFVRPPLQSGYLPGSTRQHRTLICGSLEESAERPIGSRFPFMDKDSVKPAPGGRSMYDKANLVKAKNPAASISLYWSAINTGHEVYNALKEMVTVMKQLNRTAEAIEAIKSFRGLCSQSDRVQASLDLLVMDEAIEAVMSSRSVRSQDSLDPLVSDNGIVGSKDVCPYDTAKRIELTEPNRAIPLYWSAINGGDRVYGALKAMTTLMSNMDRGDEAIEAILSFRQLCPSLSEELCNSLLTELYKSLGRSEELPQFNQDKVVDGPSTTARQRSKNQKKTSGPSTTARQRSKNRKKTSPATRKKDKVVDVSLFSSSDEDNGSSDDEVELEDEVAVLLRIYNRVGMEQERTKVNIRVFKRFVDFVDTIKMTHKTNDVTVTHSAGDIELSAMEDFAWRTFEPSSISVWLH